MIDNNRLFSYEVMNTEPITILNPTGLSIGNFNKPSDKLILAVDFDGTIVDDAFPKIGKVKPNAIESIKYLQSFGVQIILWTCRDGEYLKQALAFLLANGVKVTKANDNSDSINFKPSKKIYADYYLDDRSFPGFPGWNIFIDAFKKAYGVKND